MNCFVIGAAGRTGQEIVDQALQQGIDVTALVRSPEKLDGDRHGLTVLQGNARDGDLVRSALQHARYDAVVIAVGGSLKNDGTNQVITGNVIEVIKHQEKPPHLWILSACGTGDSYDQLNVFGRALKATMLKGPFADHEVQEEAVRTSGLPFTIVRPVGLTNGALTSDGYVARTSGKMPSSRISRADVAHYIVNHLTDTGVVGKAVALSNR